jgi:Rhodopirellula transposase DDE domain
LAGESGGVSQEPSRLSEIVDRQRVAGIVARWRLLGPELDERRRRLWTAAEASAYGPGGVGALARVTGLAQETVRRGLAELEAGERVEVGRVRRAGGGRRPLTEDDPTLVADLERLVGPATRGDPESLLRWTSKSLAHLSGALGELGHQVSDRTVGKLLRGLGYRCRPTARRARAPGIPTATGSSSTSIRPPGRRSPPGSR